MQDQEMTEVEKREVRDQVRSGYAAVEGTPESKYETTVSRHDFFYNGDQKCKTCGVEFNEHPHRLAYLQKVLANVNGKSWKLCTFKERQGFKVMAVAFMAAQLERKMKPFVESVERGPESTDTPSPSTT